MKQPVIDIKKVAQLSNLTITEKEAEKFEKQLTSIVDYIDTLNKLDTKDIEPTAQVTGLVNISRSDEESAPSLTQEQAISGAKKSHNGLFVVDQLVEEK